MAIGKLTKEALKKAKKIKEQSGAPEPGTIGARKPTPKVAPKPKPKVSPTTGKTRGRPKGSKNKPKTAAVATKISPGMKTAIAAPGVGLTTLAITESITGRKKPKATEAAKVTFGEAFKAARKKGEGTKFTYKGKSYTAVTKDDLKKKGYDANELKQYANRKGKARGPLRRAGQGIKKILLGKDKKFGGDKGAIDFIRKPKKKAAPQKKMGGGMANASAPKKYKAGGMATKGLGKAYMKSKR